MFPNLDAEQARNRHSNSTVAQILEMSRQTYEAKKSNGSFKVREIKKLLYMYGVTFEYLFAEQHEIGELAESEV